LIPETFVELYRRTKQATWELLDIALDNPLPLESLELEIPWNRIFRNVD